MISRHSILSFALFSILLFPLFLIKEDDWSWWSCCEQSALLSCSRSTVTREGARNTVVCLTRLRLCNGVHLLVFCLLKIFFIGSVASKNFVKLRYLSVYFWIILPCNDIFMLCCSSNLYYLPMVCFVSEQKSDQDSFLR